MLEGVTPITVLHYGETNPIKSLLRKVNNESLKVSSESEVYISFGRIFQSWAALTWKELS